MSSEWIKFTDLLSHIVDNRGRTCPIGVDGVPLIATNCVNGVSLYPLYDTKRFVSPETYRTWFRGHPKAGDILFVCKGSPGRTAWVPDPVDFCIAQDMVAVRPDQTKIYPKYLFAALRSSAVQSQIQNMHVGTMIPHFKKGDFDKLLIPTTDKQAQKIIGDFYFSLSQRIALLRETNKTLESIVQAIFKSWFVDFDPVRAKMEGRKPEGLDEETAALFPDSFEESGLGLIPTQWSARSFHEMIRIIGGGTPKTSNPDYWGGHIPWYSVVDAPSGADTFVVNTEKRITQSGLDGSSTKLLPLGTTIISARGTVGKLALTGCEMAMNQSCYGLRGLNNDIFFTYFSTQRLVEHLKQQAHGSVFDTITTATFKGVKVASPPPSIIARFEMNVEILMKRVLLNLKTQTSLEQLRDTLLPRLISGQFDLPEVQEQVENALQ